MGEFMKKILVTGGNGFIGSYVIENLQSKGYETVSFDREYKNQKGNFFIGDIKDSEAVLDAVGKCDGVIHLAGKLGTAETINNPIPSIEVNVLGSINVFNAIKQYQIPAVYISVGNYWMNNSYSISKDVASRFAFMFNKEHGTKITVVRGLNAYGPRQKSQPVRKIIPTFILKALKGEPIEVYGDGLQVMDMIWVKDLAEILVRALILPHGNYETAFDAGTGRKTTVNEIARTINYLVGNKAGMVHLAMRPGEPPQSVVLGDLATLKPLGKIEFTELEDGLAQTVAWYRKAYEKREI